MGITLTLVGTMLLMFSLLDTIEIDEANLGRDLSASDLKTGDLVLFSESLWSRGMCLSSVSHCVVVICNRRSEPWALEITPEQGRPALVPLRDYDCPLYVRPISRALPLPSVVEYVRLTRDDVYSHGYVRAALGLSVDVTEQFCSSLVTGLYLFCGVLTSECAKFLPRDLGADRLPTSHGYSFGKMCLLRGHS